MKMTLLTVLVLLTSLFGTVAQAADRGSPEEARAMAIKAAQYLRDAGPDTAFPAFTAKDSPWHDRDLYVFVSDQSSKMFANGGNPALVGRTLPNVRDVDGKSIPAAMAAVKDAEWVEYKWQNPTTKEIESKVAYVVRVGEFSVGVGAYK